VTKTILVVDDEVAIAETIAEILAGEGYRCEIAANGKEALAVLEGRRVDLVVLDLMMPVLDGQQTLRAIRASSKYGGVPVILASASRLVPRIADAGYDAFLPKPFGIDELLALIARLLRGERPESPDAPRCPAR
jgi:DNA-binding response OmpR family regulator